MVPVPGTSAVVAALSVAGFVEGGFHFVGFLPPKSGARRHRLAVHGIQTARAAQRIGELAANIGDFRNW